MARYLKNLEKHSLLARRKNNTASKMLEEKLKYLEQKYNRDYRQYLRIKSRVQSELRDIEDVASNYDDDDTSKIAVTNVQSQSSEKESNSQHYFRYEDFGSAKNQQIQLEITGNKKLVNSQKLSRSLNPPKNQLRPLSNSPNILNSSSKTDVSEGINPFKMHINKIESFGGESAKNRSSNNHVSSCPIDSSRSQKVSIKENAHDKDLVDKPTAGSGVLTKDFSSWSSDIVCMCSTPSHPCHCRHFPCVTPKTYHSIVDKNNDVNEITVDLYPPKKSTHPDQDEQQSSHHDRSLNPAATFAVGSQNIREKTRFPTPNRGHTSDMIELVIGPLNDLGCSSVPSKSRVEKVRNQPMVLQAEGSNRARVTVRDKMRGLKQLVIEMRARNERKKPRDWVVNYGQHFPPRVLLNPVMP